MLVELPNTNIHRDFLIDQQQRLPVFYYVRAASQWPDHCPTESMAQ